MEDESIKYLAAGTYLSKLALDRLLGPTLDYFGEEIRNFSEKRFENIKLIFSNAYEKTEDESKGSVPPRILKEIFDEGSYCDDDVGREYFGGILAGSRTLEGKNDKGVYILSLISSFSSYQLRTHYMIYSLMKVIFNGESITNEDGKKDLRLMAKREIFIPQREFMIALGINDNVGPMIQHTFSILQQYGLISSFESNVNSSIEEAIDYYEPGILVRPDSLGFEFFLWAFGKSDMVVEFFNFDLILEPNKNIYVPVGAVKSKRVY